MKREEEGRKKGGSSEVKKNIHASQRRCNLNNILLSVSDLCQNNFNK